MLLILLMRATFFEKTCNKRALFLIKTQENFTYLL